MLRHAHGRLPTMRGDAERLPFATGSVPAVIAVMLAVRARNLGMPYLNCI